MTSRVGGWLLVGLATLAAPACTTAPTAAEIVALIETRIPGIHLERESSR